MGAVHFAALFVLWNTYKPKSKLPEAFSLLIIICLSSKCKPLGLTNKTASWFNVYVLLRFVSTKEIVFLLASIKFCCPSIVFFPRRHCYLLNLP
jgi:hypothetical protein